LRHGLRGGCSNYITADLSKSIHRPCPPGQIDVSTAVEYQFSGYMRFNLNLINSRAPPTRPPWNTHFENTQYTIIVYINISVTRQLLLFFPYWYPLFAAHRFFQFPATPLLSTLYNLAPMMKYISGKCVHCVYCKKYIYICIGSCEFLRVEKKIKKYERSANSQDLMGN
jgi:hypothetical protein